MMFSDMVMRSVYLKPEEDGKLRQLAHRLNVTKSDLIRSAISVKLVEWLNSNSDDLVLHDLESGKRETAGERAARVGAARGGPIGGLMPESLLDEPADNDPKRGLVVPTGKSDERGGSSLATRIRVPDAVKA